MSESARSELKGCPFCGGDAELENTVFEATIRCSNCWASLARTPALRKSSQTDEMRKSVESDGSIFDAAIPWQAMIDAALQWPPGSADRAGVPAG